MRELSANRLRDLLEYVPETGVFRWRVTTNNRSAKAGSSAGSVKGAGYVYIQIDGKSYCAHRLAVLYMTGEWPANQVDHINGCRTDNVWSNLRCVTVSGNRMNQRRARSDNRTGLLGVHVAGRKWTASIGIAGRTRHLGTFDSPEQAHAAYVQAKRVAHATCSI